VRQFTPGGIRCPEAYAQGKMLDHSWWSGKMRGKITPSDSDMVMESYGCFLLCEISRHADTLEDLSVGQRLLLQRFAELPGTHCVTILRHGLFSISKPIDTANDIISATVYFDCGKRSVVLDGIQWRHFAIAWTYNAKNAIDTFLRPNLES
jgi:hypothetical protein